MYVVVGVFLLSRKVCMSRVDLTGARILLVDDIPTNIDILREILEPEGYEILVALNGVSALDLTRRFTPDLILLDVMMPDMDGFETCKALKADSTTENIPVIFLTARVDQADVVMGFKMGGVDYISKPFQDDELRIRVETQLRLNRLMNELVEKNAVLEAEIARGNALSEERDHLAGRLSLISDEESRRWNIDGFIGHSRTLGKILENIARLQQASNTSVLITGESGTGKELIARAIHYGSDRANGPFVPVNCSAVPHDLADSLFLGHVRGSFTGASDDRAGYFELADGGTLFLDEMGDMPLDLQAKLLRVLEDRKVLPVGGKKEKVVDVRVLSATNADLEADIQSGQFRQDLYYRLAGFPVPVPPLRDRTEDIPLLVEHFLNLFGTEMGIHAPAINDDALQVLQGYEFPGNIRELKNVVERALIESGGQMILPEHLHLRSQRALPAPDVLGMDVDALPLNLQAVEIAVVKRALTLANGNVSEAGRMLGINRMKVYRILAQEDM